MNEMRVTTLASDANAVPQIQADVRRVTIEYAGHRYIVEADAAGLVVTLKHGPGLVVRPVGRGMVGIAADGPGVSQANLHTY